MAEFEHLLGTGVSFGRVEDVKAAFFRFDKDNDGSIDRNELKAMIAATGKNASDSEIDAMFKKGDIDGDGRIDLVEFIKLMFPAATATLNKLQKSFKSINDIKATFRKWDSDGDGHISRLELRLRHSQSLRSTQVLPCQRVRELMWRERRGSSIVI